MVIGSLPPMQGRWVVWLAMIQLSLSAMCYVAYVVPRNYGSRVLLTASALWFAIQGLDEVIAGNIFPNGYVEYPILLAWFMLALYHIHRHERRERTEQRAT